MIEKHIEDMGAKTTVFATGVSSDEIKKAKSDILKALKENNISVETAKFIFEAINQEIDRRSNITKISDLF